MAWQHPGKAGPPRPAWSFGEGRCNGVGRGWGEWASGQTGPGRGAGSGSTHWNMDFSCHAANLLLKLGANAEQNLPLWVLALPGSAGRTERTFIQIKSDFQCQRQRQPEWLFSTGQSAERGSLWLERGSAHSRVAAAWHCQPLLAHGDKEACRDGGSRDKGRDAGVEYCSIYAASAVALSVGGFQEQKGFVSMGVPVDLGEGQGWPSREAD